MEHMTKYDSWKQRWNNRCVFVRVDIARIFNTRGRHGRSRAKSWEDFAGALTGASIYHPYAFRPSRQYLTEWATLKRGSWKFSSGIVTCQKYYNGGREWYQRVHTFPGRYNRLVQQMVSQNPLRKIEVWRRGAFWWWKAALHGHPYICPHPPVHIAQAEIGTRYQWGLASSGGGEKMARVCISH